MMLFIAVGSTASVSQDMVRFGPFRVDTSRPQVAVLVGEIGLSATESFDDLLARFPSVVRLELDSGGGNVLAALAIAANVFGRGISTYVPPRAACFSACAFIFFAGEERIVDGLLGVHQLTSPTPDIHVTQVVVAMIANAFERFGVPSEVRTLSLTTPPDEMHIFTPAEIAELQIERRAISVETVPIEKVPARTATTEDRLVFSYVARLGQIDHVNSQGLRLESPWQIIQQDRANYHRFGNAEPEDQGDPLFDEFEARNLIPALMAFGNLYAGANSISTMQEIIDGTPTVVVRLYEEAEGEGYYLAVCKASRPAEC